LQILPSGGTSAEKKKKKGKPGQGLEGGNEGGGGDGSSEDGEGLIDWPEMLNRPDSWEDGGDGGKMRERFQRQVSDDGGEGDKPSDSFMGSESESRDKGDGESMAGFFEEEDESLEDPSKLAKLQEFISSLPSTMKSSRRAPEDDPNKASNEHNLAIPSASG